MFPWKKIYPSPKERTPWVNKKLFIIVHHTGTWSGTTAWVIDWLYRRDDYASCHALVWEEGEAYKFGESEDILWHAGVSKWLRYENLNAYSIGIEILWPIDGTFNDAQRKTVRDLIQHYMAVYWIPKENVLRHADVTQHWGYSERWILWDWKRPARKTDVADSFWKIDRTTWKQYQDSLIPKRL